MVLPWCHIKEHCSYYHGNPDIDPKRHDTTMARVQKKKTHRSTMVLLPLFVGTFIVLNF